MAKKPVPTETYGNNLSTPVVFAERIDEVWGTTGTTYPSTLATVYSICGRLTIEKLDGPDGNPLYQGDHCR